MIKIDGSTKIIREIGKIKDEEIILKIFDALLLIIKDKKSIYPLVIKKFEEALDLQSQVNIIKGMLEIIDAVLKAIMEQKPIHQLIVEKLAKILKVERCVEFLLYPDPESMRGVLCELIAGTPEKEHGIGRIDPITDHDDLEAVLENGGMINIENPLLDERTKYFLPTIVNKQISNILYVPIKFKRHTCFSNKEVETMAGIIVIDGTRHRIFTPLEVEFCSVVGQVISKIINREERLIQKARDMYFNKLSTLNGFIARWEKLFAKYNEYVKMFNEELKKEEENFPKGGIFHHDKEKIKI
jgi:transcriptional regulator with GAF, ATPase, and Fis domain